MFFYLIALLYAVSLFGTPAFEPPKRTQKPINLIRKTLRDIPFVNEERKRLGLDPVINLSIGQPHRGMDPSIIDQMIAYLEDVRVFSETNLAKEFGYGYSGGQSETREWIAKSFTYDFPEVEDGFGPNEVMITNGAAGALTLALKVLVEEGDAVAVFAPYFSAYKNQIEDAGGTIIEMPIESNCYATLLEKTLQQHPNIKALIWNDPNNPLGSKATLEEMLALQEMLSNHPNLFVIHDEVYRDFVHNQEPLSLLNVAPELKARSILIRSFAKDTLGAPGIRAGMIAAPTDLQTPSGTSLNLIELMANEQLRDIVGVSALTQKIAVFALQSKLSGKSREWTQKMGETYARNVKLVSQEIEAMGLTLVKKAEGAFYVMVDASPFIKMRIPDTYGPIRDLHLKVGEIVQSDIDVASLLLHAAGVAVVPGSGFGATLPSFRISCAAEEGTLSEGMARIRALLQSQ